MASRFLLLLLAAALDIVGLSHILGGDLGRGAAFIIGAIVVFLVYHWHKKTDRIVTTSVDK